MEIMYVFIKQGKAYPYALVTDENSWSGNYFVLNIEKNNVEHREFKTVSDAEQWFDSLVQYRVIEAWYPLGATVAFTH